MKIKVFFFGFLLAIALVGSSEASQYSVNPCHFRLSLKGGVAPVYYASRQNTEARNFLAVAADDEVLEVDLLVQDENVRSPQFDDLFHVPWIAGAELAYAISCNSEIFLDSSYLQAKGKSNTYDVEFPAIDVGSTLEDFPGESLEIREKFDDLRSVDLHLGCRHYSACFCQCFSFFVGGKIGARYWESVDAKLTIEAAALDLDAETDITGDIDEKTIDVGKRRYYDSQIVLSGGFQVGFIARLSCCFHLQFMVEAIASCPYKFGNNINVENRDFVDMGDDVLVETELDLPVRRVGTIFIFPITLGFGWTF